MNHSPHEPNQKALKLIAYCIDCIHPENDGSILFALSPKFGISEYKLTGELIYGVPNYGESDEMLNSHEYRSRIVLVHRGKIDLKTKVANVQKNGASGIVIIDDGQCNEAFTFCGPRAGSVQEGGFAPMDNEQDWKKIVIPVCLISQSSGSKLVKLLEVSRVYIPQFGYQNVTPEVPTYEVYDGDL